ncbi:MAG: hypothetical protein C4523_00535 [Myxococcales bacterium]|nr:MAG: hypothetical protein C4523_00535 [Myxococcales bacterium]
MKSRVGLFVGLVVVALLGAACNSSGDGGVSFAGSPCKKEMAQESAQARLMHDEAGSDGEVADNSAYDGLQCVRWNIVAGGVSSFDFINYEGACGADWHGEGSVSSPDEVELRVVNPDCVIAMCGSCLYDWSFIVEGLTAAAPLSVAFVMNSCPDEHDGSAYELTLPVDTEPQGIECQYANPSALDWHASSADSYGELHMPCTDSPMRGEDTPDEPLCHGELVCHATGVFDAKVCMQPCAEDADCPLPDVLACLDSVCQIKPE